MNKGFTIFFATLVASLSLAVGLAIYDLTVRELQLSQTATQSQAAIYAADSGVECAVYWDAKYNGTGSAFATSSASGVPSGVLCNAQNIITGAAPLNFPWQVTTAATAATTTFKFALDGTSAAKPCATVIVEKSGTPSLTTITSNGFNTCVTGGVTQVQRTLRVTY